MSKTWSPLQTAIFNLIEDPNGGNAIIEAVAGSGKTTTIVEGVKRARGTTIFLAFNKSIAEELKSRGVNARTFHSLTYGPVTQHKGVRTVEIDKLRRLCDAKLKGEEADRVFWLGRNECPAKWARQDWQKQQEVNLCYVAATRAKWALYTIEARQ